VLFYCECRLHPILDHNGKHSINTLMQLRCQDLCKTYPTRNGGVPALRDVTFGIEEHEFVCIVGPSGCGKTTLLKLIAGLDEPTKGSITFTNGTQERRPRNSLVFQEHGLLPWMTVLDNVAIGLERSETNRSARRQRAMAFIERVGLAHFASSYPHELSVGMRQRTGIARALLADTPVLLMDEPFGSLDAQTKIVLREELLGLWTENRKLVIFVTHDIEEALLLGDRVLAMTGRPGRIREEIPVPLSRPRALSDIQRTDISEIKWHIWKMLEDEVRGSLGMPC
jgi:NitT/TauT family transport system ATP-binding protein